MGLAHRVVFASEERVRDRVGVTVGHRVRDRLGLGLGLRIW